MADGCTSIASSTSTTTSTTAGGSSSLSPLSLPSALATGAFFLLPLSNPFGGVGVACLARLASPPRAAGWPGSSPSRWRSSSTQAGSSAMAAAAAAGCESSCNAR
eukprot:scaffold8150_cov116-Isochrysis_galbana.AAC.7